MGYELSDNMRAESVVKALRQAAKQRQTQRLLMYQTEGYNVFCHLPARAEAP